MRIEVSDRAAKVLVGIATLALLVFAGVAATLLPPLLHVVEELPASGVVQGLATTQAQVGRIDHNVQDLTPPVTTATRNLSDLSPQLRGLSTQLAAADATIARLRASIGSPAPGSPDQDLAEQLAALQTSLGQAAAGLRQLAGPLGPMAIDLHRLAGDAGTLPTSLDRVNTALAVLARLPGYFDSLQRTLDEMAVHVRNLDRKTGPVLP